MNPQIESKRVELLRAAVSLLNDNGPGALKIRKIAAAAEISTMAVYTHFGGMPGLISGVAEEGLRRFNVTLTMPQTADPVADLFAVGIAHRRFAIAYPYMYWLMFGSTNAHAIKVPPRDVLTLTRSEISDRYPSFAHVVRAVHRSMLAGRISAGSADDDPAVIAVAAQFWASTHGFVMLELGGYFGGDGTGVALVLTSMTSHLLIALGDMPERVEQSQRSATGSIRANQNRRRRSESP
jgi:AcrR family transcriptional regulator